MTVNMVFISVPGRFSGHHFLLSNTIFDEVGLASADVLRRLASNLSFFFVPRVRNLELATCNCSWPLSVTGSSITF